MPLTTLAKLLYKTCHSPNQRTQFILPRDGKNKKGTEMCLFCWLLNRCMITCIAFSKFENNSKPSSPVGNTAGYGTLKVAPSLPPVYKQTVDIKLT